MKKNLIAPILTTLALFGNSQVFGVKLELVNKTKQQLHYFYTNSDYVNDLYNQNKCLRPINSNTSYTVPTNIQYKKVYSFGPGRTCGSENEGLSQGWFKFLFNSNNGITIYLHSRNRKELKNKKTDTVKYSSNEDTLQITMHDLDDDNTKNFSYNMKSSSPQKKVTFNLPQNNNTTTDQPTKYTTGILSSLGATALLGLGWYCYDSQSFIKTFTGLWSLICRQKRL